MSSYDDTDGLYQVEEMRDRLGSMLVMTAIIVTGLFILLLLWRLCFTEKEETRKPLQNTPQPVFAHEIHPGCVVLQSQDGQFFRVLQEYSDVKWNRKGCESPASGHNQCAAWRPIEEVESIVYTPQYTSAHYQTQPSAPRQHDMPSTPACDASLIGLNPTMDMTYPPPYCTH